eukprot:3439587-Pyramimonas_sp.AAC.1
MRDLSFSNNALSRFTTLRARWYLRHRCRWPRKLLYPSQYTLLVRYKLKRCAHFWNNLSWKIRATNHTHGRSYWRDGTIERDQRGSAPNSQTPKRGSADPATYSC